MAIAGTSGINTRIVQQPFGTSIAIPRIIHGNGKELGRTNVPLIDPTRERKHRFTIFIGYGDEAGNLLKRCEQLKCKLRLSTNMQFLTFLLEYYDRHSSGYQIDTEAIKKEACKKPSESNISSYVYDAKLKTFNTVTQQPTTTIQNLSNITNQIGNLSYDPSLSNISNIVVTATTPQCNNKIMTGQHNSAVALKQQLELITLQNQINTNIISITSGGANIITNQRTNNSNPILHNTIELPCSIDTSSVNFENNVFNPLALTTTNTKSHDIGNEYMDSDTKSETAIVLEPPSQG